MFILIYIDNLFIICEYLNIINGFKNKLLEYFYIINFELIFDYLSIFII